MPEILAGPIAPGARCTYDSHGADTTLNARTGERVTVLRALTADEADLAVTGPMYRVRFADGMETDVFVDEIGG